MQQFLELLEVLKCSKFHSCIRLRNQKNRIQILKTWAYILWVHEMKGGSVSPQIPVFEKQKQQNVNSTYKTETQHRIYSSHINGNFAGAFQW